MACGGHIHGRSVRPRLWVDLCGPRLRAVAFFWKRNDIFRKKTTTACWYGSEDFKSRHHLAGRQLHPCFNPVVPKLVRAVTQIQVVIMSHYPQYFAVIAHIKEQPCGFGFALPPKNCLLPMGVIYPNLDPLFYYYAWADLDSLLLLFFHYFIIT